MTAPRFEFGEGEKPILPAVVRNPKEGSDIYLSPFTTADVERVRRMTSLDQKGEFAGLPQYLTTRFLDQGVLPWYQGDHFERVTTTDPRFLFWSIRPEYCNEPIGFTLLIIGKPKEIDGQIYRWGETGIYMHNPHMWDRGIATAAHNFRTYWAFEVLGLDYIYSEVFRPNEASDRALTQQGYFPFKTALGRRGDGEFDWLFSYIALHPGRYDTLVETLLPNLAPNIEFDLQLLANARELTLSRIEQAKIYTQIVR